MPTALDICHPRRPCPRYSMVVADSDSLHPEWDLMYRKGLSVSKIASLCGAVKGTVDRHIRLRKQADSSLQEDHENNRPAPKPRPSWYVTLEAVAFFHAQHGVYPTPSADPEVDRLARWLTAQRAALRAQALTQAKHEALRVLPQWSEPQRPRLDAERWDRRLMELQMFKETHGRWPQWKRPGDEHERLLGVWLHARRQEASSLGLSNEHKIRLDRDVPGWNTWRSRPSG